MLQDTITLQNQHKNFIKKVSESQIVYALKGDKGYAVSYSNDMEHEDGSPVQVVCFWSVEALAKSCIENEWEEYIVDSIPLNDFLENWCLGMNSDGIMTGTDFNNNLFGSEVEPIELILDIIEELKRIEKPLEFVKFENIEDLETQIRDVLNS